MKKKGGSELIAEILLIVLVIMIIALVFYFFLGYLGEKEKSVKIQNELNSEQLDVDDVQFDSNPQKLTLVLGKGASGQTLSGRNSTNVSRMNVTVVRLVNQTNITHTNTTIVTFVNQTNVTHTNITIVPHVNHTIVTNTTIINYSADIVFTIDSTGSMYDEIQDVKDIITNFTKVLENGTSDWRLGLIEFKDYPTGYCGGTGDFPFKIHTFSGGQFTKNASEFRNRVGAFYASGGADWPESQLTALTQSISMSWRTAAANVKRFEVLITDSPPHATDCTWCGSNTNAACYLGPTSVAGVTLNIVNNNITLYHINKDEGSCISSGICEGNRINAEPMTNPTGGKFYKYTESGGVQGILLEIAENVSETIVEVNVSWNETIDTSWNETVTTTWNETVNVTWNETVTTIWIEQINETINETVEIEVYTPDTSYDYLKIVFYTSGKSFSKRENVSSVPGPHETKEVQITLDPAWGINTNDLTKIEIYVVALEGGKEIISDAPIAVWEKESFYTRR